MENVDTMENKEPCANCTEGYILTGQGAQSGVRTSCPACLGTGLDRVADAVTGWREFVNSDTLRTIERARYEEKLNGVLKAMQRIGFDPDAEFDGAEPWDLEELSENLEPGDMVRVIYRIGKVLMKQNG